MSAASPQVDPEAIRSLLLGLASNGLWAFAVYSGGRAAQALKKLFARREDTVAAAIRDAAASVLDTLPAGDDRARARIARFLKSSEAETVVRQLYATKLADSGGAERIDSIRKEFLACLSLHLDISVDRLADAGDHLFRALRIACDRSLAWAIEHGVLAAHEATSTARHQVLRDTLAGIEKSLILLAARDRPSVDSISEFEEKYREQVDFRHAHIQPPHFNGARKVPIDDLYVAPSLSTVPHVKGEQPTRLETPDFLSQLHRTVVLGNPGSGKSTFALKLVHDLAIHRTTRTVGGRELTPILVVLREYGRVKKAENCSILQFIELQSNSLYQLQPPLAAFEYLLLSGRALVIFDGLDELLETSYRREISADVESFARLYPNVPLLVTSREVGYEQAPLDRAKFRLFRIAPFDEEQVRQYASKWFGREEDYTPEQRREKADAFLDESRPAADLRSNPLMLSLMCNLYRVEGYIPRNRADVYEKCSLMLFERWDKSRGILVQRRVSSTLRHPAWEFTDLLPLSFDRVGPAC